MVTLDVLSTSQGRPAADTSLDVTYRPYGDVLRTSGRFWGISSGRPRDVILQSGLINRH